VSERARRPSLARTVVYVAMVALVCATLVWSTLAYSAAQQSTPARAPLTAQPPQSPIGGPATSSAPLTTRTS
jgi:hypothetical protein